MPRMDQQRVCKGCALALPIEAFYLNRGRPMGKCKECVKVAVRSWYRSSKPERQAYERERLQRPERRKAKQRYEREARERSPDKYAAHVAVGNAVRDGKLIRQPCEGCGEARSQAHHDDYSKPLEVRWLCFVCHRRHHGQDP